MSYDELWNFYEQTLPSIQDDIVRQLKEILSTASDKVKKEVLKNAPDEVKQMFEAMRVPSGKSREQLMRELGFIIGK